MLVCIPSKDNNLLYNIFEEEAGSHSNYDIIPTIKHPYIRTHAFHSWGCLIHTVTRAMQYENKMVYFMINKFRIQIGY